jgi:hypothetical protein
MVKTTRCFALLIFIFSNLYGGLGYQEAVEKELQIAYEHCFDLYTYLEFKEKSKIEEWGELSDKEFVDKLIKAHKEHIAKCREIGWPEGVMKRLEEIQRILVLKRNSIDWRHELRESLVDISSVLGAFIAFYVIFNDIVL